MAQISVIMPCYNTEKKMLFKCIRSILSQSFSDFELIIVDDGSEKSYREIYKNKIFSDKRIKVLMKENGGVSTARNYGLEYVSGNYVVFADSDDILLPCFFEEAVETAVKYGADIVYGCNAHIADYKKVKNSVQGDVSVLSGIDILSLKPNMVGERLRFNNGLIYIGRGPWTRLVKKELAVSVPFTEGLAICEDIIWNLQLLDKAQKVCIVKKAWYLYNLGNTSSSTKRFNRNIIAESKKGLEETKKYLSLNNDREFKAFNDKCFEELNRIFYGFVGHREMKASLLKKYRISSKLFSDPTWQDIGSHRYFKLCSKKDKIRCVLFKLNLYFPYLKAKLLIK